MDRPAQDHGVIDWSELKTWPQDESDDYEVAHELINGLIAVHSSLFFYAKTEEEKERHRVQLLKYAQQQQELDALDKAELQRVVAEYAETRRRHEGG